MRHYLDDPQAIALELLEKHRRFVHGICPFSELREALGSDENVWQVIARLRRQGYKIRTFPRARGRSFGLTPWDSKHRAGYGLTMKPSEVRVGFHVLG